MHDSCKYCGAKCILNICTDCTQKENGKVVYTEHYIGAELFEKWSALYSGQSLSEGDRAKGVFVYEGKMLVCFGGSSGGKQAPRFDCHEVIPAEMWDGPKLSSAQLTDHNGSGGPFHGNYQLFTCKGNEFVVKPYLVTRFIRNDELVYEQESLF
jgi:hypothetical protein